MFVNHNIKIINNTKKKSNFFCNLCSYTLLSIDDFLCHSQYDCCYDCFLTFAESRKSEWTAGWRPDKTKIDKHIYLRKQMYNKIINITED
jgi:hypothetical protein